MKKKYSIEKLRSYRATTGTAHRLQKMIISSNDLQIVEEIFHVAAGFLVETLTNEQGQLREDNEEEEQDKQVKTDLTL